jgi:Flp pilus assembly protein TadD
VRGGGAQGQKGARIFQDGRFEEALQVFSKLNIKAPGDPEVLLNMGLCYEQLQRLSDAEDFYRRATNADPGSAPAWSALGI